MMQFLTCAGVQMHPCQLDDHHYSKQNFYINLKKWLHLRGMQNFIRSEGHFAFSKANT